MRHKQDQSLEPILQSTVGSEQLDKEFWAARTLCSFCISYHRVACLQRQTLPEWPDPGDGLRMLTGVNMLFLWPFMNKGIRSSGFEMLIWTNWIKSPWFYPLSLRASMMMSVYIGLQGRKQNCSSSFDVLPPFGVSERDAGRAGWPQSPGHTSARLGD